MTRLFIVRHGNTFAHGEPSRRIGARTNLPLVESGVAQAEMLGKTFERRGLAFTTAYSGQLLRSRETASLILARCASAPPLQLASWLDEIDHGPDEGQLEENVVARLGTSALAAWDANAIVPQGWNVDRTARLAAWRRILDTPPPGDVLLVTSNGAARFALLAASLSGRSSLKLGTGCYGEMHSDGEHGWVLAAWNAGADEH